MGSKTKIQIPYKPDGSVPHYPDNFYGPYEWRDPEPFKATLTLERVERGRSAAYFVMKDKKGAHFTVFLTDIEKMIRDPRWVAGVITAEFEPCKRGENYGVRLVKP